MPTQLDLTEDQVNALRILSVQRGTSLPELVRESIDLLLSQQVLREQARASLVQRALSASGKFRSGRRLRRLMVFVDTSAILALLDRDDQYHSRADRAWVTPRQHEIGLAMLIVANRRKLSLADCVSFAVMRERRAHEAFAFDAHFREEGFDCDPKPG